MASATVVRFSVDQPGIFHTSDISIDSADISSRVLQENHEKHHIFYRSKESGKQIFHNHIVHHIVTLYALGASPSQIDAAYKANVTDQLGITDGDVPPTKDLQTEVQDFAEFLHAPQHSYPDYLTFFQAKIEKDGWQKVLQKYLFAGDDLAELLFPRLVEGFHHPLIHVGCGIEFEQPAIIAEGLALCCTHTDDLTTGQREAEKIARASTEAGKTPFALLDVINANEKLRTSCRFDDPNKIRSGLLVRAPNEMVQVWSQYHISPSELDFRHAEMFAFCAFMTICPQNPKKEVKIDFYFMHAVNAATFISVFLAQDWLSIENKTRLLEWKLRVDLALYISRGCPKLLVDEVQNYQPRYPMGWDDLITRSNKALGDGHTNKLIRGLAQGARVCKPYEEEQKWPIRGDLWLQAAHMVLDSAEDVVVGHERWARDVGFPEAWDRFKDR